MKTSWLGILCVALGVGLVAVAVFGMSAESLLVQGLLYAAGLGLAGFGVWVVSRGSTAPPASQPAPARTVARDGGSDDDARDLGSFIRSREVLVAPSPRDDLTGYGQVRPMVDPSTGKLTFAEPAAASSHERAASSQEDSSEPRTGVFKRLKDESYATPADREELIAVLTRHIGAMARIIVDRIDAHGLTRNDLFMEAAQAIEDDDVRDRFMEEMGLYR